VAAEVVFQAGDFGLFFPGKGQFFPKKRFLFGDLPQAERRVGEWVGGEEERHGQARK